MSERQAAGADAHTLRARREALVREHMQSENVHDFDTTMGTFGHPRYELVATGESYDGEAQVAGYYAETRAAFPDQRNELIALHHADDAVIAEFWLLGTHLGPLRALPPTGRSFRCQMTALFLFEGEELVCERVYFDQADDPAPARPGARPALGAGPDRARAEPPADDRARRRPGAPRGPLDARRSGL